MRRHSLCALAALTAACGGTPEEPPHRVFVTATGYTGNLVAAANATNGLDAADKLCMTAAQAINLGGSWRAWLSDGTAHASERLVEAGPWHLLEPDGGTGPRVFNNKANMATVPLTAIERTEHGSTLGSATVWTGTLAGGNRALQHCDNWSNTSSVGQYGDAKSTTEKWTAVSSTPTESCAASRHLYCIEQ